MLDLPFLLIKKGSLNVETVTYTFYRRGPEVTQSSASRSMATLPDCQKQMFFFRVA